MKSLHGFPHCPPHCQCMCTPNSVPSRVSKAKTFVSSASLRAAILTLQSEASSTTITTRRDILARVYWGLTEQGSQGSASKGEDCFSSRPQICLIVACASAEQRMWTKKCQFNYSEWVSRCLHANASQCICCIHLLDEGFNQKRAYMANMCYNYNLVPICTYIVIKKQMSALKWIVF